MLMTLVITCANRIAGTLGGQKYDIYYVTYGADIATRLPSLARSAVLDSATRLHSVA